jgi:hypothetical protein
MLGLMLALVLVGTASTPELRAEDDDASRPVADPSPFRRAYLALEAVRNDPISFSEQHFSPGTIEPDFSYLHSLHNGDETWLMGLGAQFKVFARDSDEAPPSRYLAIWTLFHEILYAARLGYPTYLLVGPKIMYMLPADTGRLPLARDTGYDLEIGGALTVELARVLGDGKRLATLRIDRWRGTKTQKLMGVEIAAGMAWELN